MTDPMTTIPTTLTVPDSPKMIRETLCVAQTALGYHPHHPRRAEHMARLQRLVDECDRTAGGEHGLAERVERYTADPAEHEPDRLTPEQHFRIEAGHMATALLDDCAGTPAGMAARLVELAVPLVGWIRDGTVPVGAGYGCLVDGPDPRCPEHGDLGGTYR